MTPDEVLLSGVHEIVPTPSPASENPQAVSPFQSVLFLHADDYKDIESQSAPDFFKDLNLDQVVDAITDGYKEYNLAPFFYAHLQDLDSVAYRQEVMRDLETGRLVEAITTFSAAMRAMRKHLKQAQELYYRYAIERGFLGAVAIYYNGVGTLSLELASIDLNSRGLRAFREFLAQYVASPEFRKLVNDGDNLVSDFSRIRYSLILKDGSVTVRSYEEESDYSETVEETFAKFSRETSNNYRLKAPAPDTINHIQAQILDGVALLYPDTFQALDDFNVRHADHLDPTISRFDREIHFFIAYLSYSERLRRANFSFCLPEISQTSKEVRASDAFDIVLADKLLRENQTVVCNSFVLRNRERMLVVSGPNHGGKTTFARMFGQLHYLGSLGCPVPGKDAALFLWDRIFTHFEHEEDIANLRGKLHDDLVRIRAILDLATPNSIVIMNEIFSSTTIQDAVHLSKKVMAKFADLDVLGVCVTFLDELASFNEKTVSMVSMVDPQDPAIRTYRLERRPADGLAYAHALAEKYRVTYRDLKQRIRA